MHSWVQQRFQSRLVVSHHVYRCLVANARPIPPAIISASYEVPRPPAMPRLKITRPPRYARNAAPVRHCGLGNSAPSQTTVTARLSVRASCDYVCQCLRDTTAARRVLEVSCDLQPADPMEGVSPPNIGGPSREEVRSAPELRPRDRGVLSPVSGK